MWNRCAVLTNVLVGSFFATLGYLYKNSTFEDAINKNRIEVMFISLVILAEAWEYSGYMGDLRTGKLDNGVWMLITSIAGILFLLSIAKLLCETKYIRSLLNNIGKLSLWVLLLHIPSFSLVTFIAVKVFKYTFTANCSNSINEGVFPIINAIVGISVPISIFNIFEKIKKREKYKF
jgi:fucose 4-O-acetylase-like acetyltransferase